MKLLQYGMKCFARIYFSGVYEIFRLATKVDNTKVLFISDVREELEGNLKCIWDKLDENEYLKRTYLKGDRRDIINVFQFTQMIYDFATSKYILLEDYFRYTSYVRPKSNQEICQLWHACGAYKKFGYSRANGNEKIKIHKGYKKYAKVITSSETVRKNYAEAFGVAMNKVMATGIPRTDLFFSAEDLCKCKNTLYKKYPVLKDKKVILFAPTYRGLAAEDATYAFDKLDYEKMYLEFHKEYIFVIKWHPALYNNLKRNNHFESYISSHPDFYIDLSCEREVNEILPIADVLITDYSSVIFEYALLERPIVYFIYDYDEYANSRGIYYDFNDYIYGEIAKNSKELIDAIKMQDLKPDLRKKFIKKFMDSCDGKSTERVCKWIFNSSGKVDTI